MTDQKQLFQTQNILETLIEATDHFLVLIKQKELNQSIYIFSSIVEGSQAIIQMLHTQDDTFQNQTKNLEKHLLLISKELEQGRFIKVAEIIQFSLRPLFVKLKRDFINELGDQKADKTISIGIFHSWINPREAFPKQRLQATLNEGEKQHTNLYFFTSTDIDFENKQINADTFRNHTWERVTVPFPDVINNTGAGRHSQAERKLQRIVPFTSFHVGNKFTLPRRMLQLRKFADLLVPFTVCMSEDKTYQFIENNNKAVFKALGSNRGEDIYFVTKKGSRYIMLDQKKERILSESDFKQFVEQTILAEKGSYIIQRYIHTRTKADEPYHFRSHVQKDHHGEWGITHIYPRIGSKKSNLSNISTEGRVEDFPTFLREQYGEKQGGIYEKEILDLSIDVTKQLDKLYGMTLNELGLDFAIDDTGRIWMHEANNGPQTAYHEEKRAINFIAYAKYIAENGVMHISHESKSAIAKGQFQAIKTDLPLANHESEICVGMLAGKQTYDDISTTFAKTANDYNAAFYTFTPIDIDYDLELIRGSFYENGKWVQKVAEFPSVIIDRLKLRNSPEARIIYEELEGIPFTNEWATDSTIRSTIYRSLQDDKDIGNSIGAFQNVNRPLHVFQFLEQYGQVQLKQEDMAYSKPIYTIRKCDNGEYEVLTETTRKVYRENQLRNYIHHLIEDNRYIVQLYPAIHDILPEIHAFIMKDDHHKWTTVSVHAELTSIESDDSITLSKQTLDKFTGENIEVTGMKEQLTALSIKTGSVMEDKLKTELSEVALTFAVEDDQILRLIEANPNGPKAVYDIDIYSGAVIKYAMSLGTTEKS